MTAHFETYEQRVMLSHNFAPLSLATKTLSVKIQHGAGNFAHKGKYAVYFNSLGYYQLFGGVGVSDSYGVYTYSKQSNTAAYASFIDSNIGAVSTEVLTFKSLHSGVFIITASDGSYQSGTFTL
jgi:hypothetical protein